jgi:hypothetical protein
MQNIQLSSLSLIHYNMVEMYSIGLEFDIDNSLAVKIN